MRQLLVHFLVWVLVIGFPGTTSAGDLKWIGQRGEKKWKPHFELSFRSGNHDRYGLELDPFIPIAQNDRSLWFLNVRNGLSWVNNDFRHEINVGGGYRRIVGERWILGGYGFFDRVKTSFDNYFNQGTLGVEALSLDWDLRFNGYIADDTTKSAGGGGVQLVGTQLKMDSGVEQALSGFDGELGWRLPFASNSLLGDTRLYAGGFLFEASDVANIGGPRTRFEMRFHDIPFLWEGSRITLGTEYTWDHVRGSEVTSLVSLRIPFGAPSRRESLTPLERRMTDRVVRDVAVMTNVGGGTELVQSQAGVVIGDTFFFDRTGGGDGSFTSPFDLPTAIPTGAANALLIGLDSTGDITGLAETLLDGQTVLGGGTSLLVQGVNSGNMGLFTAPGSAATFSGVGSPTLTLARNNTIAGLTFSGMSEALRLTQSGGSSITSILGNTFNTVGPGINANWSGSFDATLNLRDNTFQAGTFGLLASLAPDGSSGASSFDLAASGNSFDSLGTAISVGVAASGIADYSHRSAISGNTFTSNGNDYELIFGGAGATGFIDIDVAVNSNFSTGAGSDFTNVSVGSVASGHVDLEISDNDIVNAGGKAIDIDLDAAPDFDGVISNNRIVTAGNDGIRVDVYASGSLNGHSLSISNNTIQNVGDDGIDVYFGYGYDATIAINDNTIQYAFGDGIEVDFDGNGHAAGNVAVINNNNIQFVSDNGIDVYFGYGYDATVTIADNTISDAGGDGIYFYFYYNGHDVGNSLTINRNTIQDVGANGIYVYNYYYNLDTATSITENTISDAGDDGIHFSSYYYNGHYVGDSLTISNNTIQNVGDDGIDVYFYWSNLDESVTIFDNTIADAGDDGIYFYSYFYNGYYGDPDGPGHSLTISRNDIDRVGGGGIDVYFWDDYRDTSVTIADNSIRDVYGQDGIAVYLDDVGHLLGSSVTINGNDVANVFGAGIEVDVYNYYGAATVTIADNTIDQSGGDGIDVYTDAATTLSSSLGGPTLDNVVTNVGGSDADLSGGFSGSLQVNGVSVP